MRNINFIKTFFSADGCFLKFIKTHISIDGCFLRTYLPFLYHLYLKIYFFNREDKSLCGEKKCFGNQNPEKTFFLIRMENYGMGVFGYFNCVLGYLKYAQKKGYIPVIDMKNYPNSYLEKDEVGKINSWEYYFDQPDKYTLDEVYKSKNVVLSTGINTIETSPTVLWFYLYRWRSKKRSKEYFHIIDHQLEINRQTQLILDENYCRILEGKRVTGVVKRGSDIVNCGGHAIQPELTELIDRTERMLAAWNCDYVFLATEEEETVTVFQKIFGDKLLTNTCARVSNYTKGAYCDITFNRHNDKYFKGLEYLTTVYLLSRCTALIGSLVGATAGALGLNRGNYENVYVYDLGVYPHYS